MFIGASVELKWVHQLEAHHNWNIPDSPTPRYSITSQPFHQCVSLCEQYKTCHIIVLGRGGSKPSFNSTPFKPPCFWLAASQTNDLNSR